MKKPAAAAHEHHHLQHHDSNRRPLRPASGMSHGGHDEHASHDRHAGHSVEMFRQKFWGTLLLSIPTIISAPMIRHWFGLSANDLGAPVTLFGQNTTTQGAVWILLMDQHEHLGQSIAYARSNMVVPPWSK